MTLLTGFTPLFVSSSLTPFSIIDQFPTESIDQSIMPRKEVLERRAAGKTRKIARRACDVCRSRRIQVSKPALTWSPLRGSERPWAWSFLVLLTFILHLVQCLFSADSSAACLRCLRHDVPCTFLTSRKPRGPPSRYVHPIAQSELN
jgi:hypothetical protein